MEVIYCRHTNLTRKIQAHNNKQYEVMQKAAIVSVLLYYLFSLEINKKQAAHDEDNNR